MERLRLPTLTSRPSAVGELRLQFGAEAVDVDQERKRDDDQQKNNDDNPDNFQYAIHSENSLRTSIPERAGNTLRSKPWTANSLSKGGRVGASGLRGLRDEFGTEAARACIFGYWGSWVSSGFGAGPP